MDRKSAPDIRDLYPMLSDEDIAKAEENIERYLALVLRIFERMETDIHSDCLTDNNGTLPCTPLESPASN